MNWDGKEVKTLSDGERKERFMVMLVTVSALVSFRNDAVGFIAGLLWHGGYKLTHKFDEWQGPRQGTPFWRRFSHGDEEGARLLD